MPDPRPTHQITSQKQDQGLVMNFKIQELWLDGYRPAEISVRTGLTIERVHGGIRTARKQLYEDSKATLSEHSEQSVAILRRLQTRLYQLYESEEVKDKPRNLLRVIDEIRRIEETIAKIRGVLSNKVIADVIHHVKLYDFQDNLPPAPGEAVIVESEMKELSPVPSAVIESELDTPSAPEFEETDGILILAGGDIIDIDEIVNGD